MSWDLVVGQQEAVRRLEAAVTAPVHAYLFVGPGGAGKRRAATVFAGELLAAADPDNAERHRRLAVDESHADVHMLDPVGNNLRRDEEAEPLIVQASRSPVEGKRKVLIVNRFHTATAAAAASLLKTIEEPPATSIFVLLAEDVPPEHITIESRCTRVDFPPIAEEAIADALVAEGLASPEQAPIIAAAASGSVERRTLVADDRLVARRDAWWSIPDRLDGTGAAVAVMVEEVRALIDDAGKAKVAQHDAELEAMDAREEQLVPEAQVARISKPVIVVSCGNSAPRNSASGSPHSPLRYREAIVAGDDRRGLLDGIDALRHTQDALVRNPNEALALQALLLRLPSLAR